MPRITHIQNESFTTEDEEGLQDRLFAVLENGDRFEIDPRDKNIVFRAFENRDDDFDPERDLGRNSRETLVSVSTGDLEVEVAAEMARAKSNKAAPKGQR